MMVNVNVNAERAKRCLSKDNLDVSVFLLGSDNDYNEFIVYQWSTLVRQTGYFIIVEILVFR